MITKRQTIAKYSDLKDDVKNILIQEIAHFLNDIEEDFSNRVWDFILQESTEIIKNYTDLNTREYDFSHMEKSGNRKRGNIVWLKEKYKNSHIINKVKIVEISSLYPNKIIRDINERKLLFRNNFTNILIPLMGDIRTYVKKNNINNSNKNADRNSKYFLNYIFGKMSFPYSNMVNYDLIEELEAHFKYIFETFEHIIYIDVDEIYIKDSIPDKEFDYLKSVLEFHNYSYNITDNKYMLITEKKRYILFNENMEIEKNTFKIID